MNVLAPLCVIGWIRRWIAGNLGVSMQATGTGVSVDDDSGCCVCLLGPS